MTHKISEELAVQDVETIIASVRDITEDPDEQDIYLHEFIAFILEKKDWQKAESLALAINDSAVKVEQYLQIVNAEFLAEPSEKILELVKKAKEIAYQREANWQKAETLTLIAYALAKIAYRDESLLLFDEAIAVAHLGKSDGFQDSIDASSVLWEIAERLAVLGESEKANQVANDINNPHKQQKAIDGVKSILQGGKSWFVQS